MTTVRSSRCSIPVVAGMLALGLAPAGAQQTQLEQIAGLIAASAPAMSGIARRSTPVARSAAASEYVPTPGTPSTDSTRTQDPGETWFDRLGAWVQAVALHVPGRVDAPVLTISAWTAGELEAIAKEFVAFHRFLSATAKLAGKDAPGQVSPGTIYRKHVLTGGLLRSVQALDNAAGADRNRALKRGAMLHADVALLAPVDRSRSTGGSNAVRSVDGRVIGYESSSAHWLVGRQLLDALDPDPAADPFVRLWYYATAASLLEEGNLAGARPHIEHALIVLPEDAGIQFQSGFLHQASASPGAQAAVASASSGRQAAVMARQRSERGRHRKEAERRFRRAVTLDPGHVEARIRLGFALLELGRAEDALAELRPASGATQDPTLSYWSALFLGRAETLVGHREAAVDRYRRASQIFPHAQSAPLALAQLARRRGDRTSAWRSLAPLQNAPRSGEPRFDPWWAFYRRQLRSAETLLSNVRALAQSERTP